MRCGAPRQSLPFLKQPGRICLTATACPSKRLLLFLTACAFPMAFVQHQTRYPYASARIFYISGYWKRKKTLKESFAHLRLLRPLRVFLTSFFWQELWVLAREGSHKLFVRARRARISCVLGIFQKLRARNCCGEQTRFYSLHGQRDLAFPFWR